jgi:hypothetical protein
MSKKKNGKSRFSRNGFFMSINGNVNTETTPYGFNWALGYCEQSTDELLAKNTCKKRFMDMCEVLVNQSSPRSLSK